MGKFILGDCMDLETGLPSYPDGFFDLAIVDPPYGIGMAANPVRQFSFWSWHGIWQRQQPAQYFDELFRVSKRPDNLGG
jgi:site-specific DNA-methyltransferase (adenine-specific)